MSLIKRETLKNFYAFLFGCIIAFLILELFLRFYNPFGFRVKGDKIVLYPYKKYKIHNLNGQDIIHTKNSLGFRGKEPSAKFDENITIIAIGGSTTEGYYLNDGKTWPEVLGKNLSEKIKNVWINNAGLDGQSTYGHLVLLEDYILKIKPKIAVFYCGLNDLGLSAMNRYDNDMATLVSSNKFKYILNVLAKNSETISAIINMVNYFKTKNINLMHRNKEYETEDKKIISAAELDKILKNEKENILNYKIRLEKIIKLCRENNIEPVFITQAILCGDFKDVKTGKYLGYIPIKNKFINYTGHSKTLKLYNDEMIKVAKENNVFLIDAAALMPHSSEYYYDCVHFNETGAKYFAQMIYYKFLSFIKNKYNNYIQWK